MNNYFKEKISEITGTNHIEKVEEIQSLWSGYGRIQRFYFKEGRYPSVVVKHISYPEEMNHPRGWNTSVSHQRKLHSYQVEIEWYKKWSDRCSDECYTPGCLGVEQQHNEILIVLEDLNSTGFPKRAKTISLDQMEVCLRWLAYFHAIFMNSEPSGLWPIGTYWHLDTRPDELEQLTDKNLKQAASMIDRVLNQTKHKTLVHGDAKLANFCFSDDMQKVAAVDFQYVGGGCGMKDVAYFIGSCLYEEDCEKYENHLLNTYFMHLKTAIFKYNNDVNFDALEQEWREMYPYAWADFHRFLKGWSPGHWKINSYSEKMTRKVLPDIENRKASIKK
ncbi:oxidoreductase family protein [Alkalitalea saponilacus]|uniref:Ecdysteroid kinase n=1 Tax=Alkalitalea saponilacus TaxID=889453 RepID=A0A1T5HMY6_9BACT|nr:oxidoreductase family protein [Alkalitalea saponilacus]ASB49369.1 choline kinase [Alkalitalea saponilacus]SKC22039.1 Ecdysteroid kinase [Alkalitalea saponilacus]